MKAVKILSLLIVLFSFSSVSAFYYEFYFYVKNNAGEAQARSIVIYRYDETSKSYIQIASGTSESSWGRYGANGPNAICNIIEVDPADPDPNITPNIHWYETYIVRIENKFVTLTYGGGADATFEYNTELDRILVTNAMWNVTYHQNQWNDKSILLKNNFTGGDMWINSYRETNILSDSLTRYREATTFPHTLTAIDNQQPGSYKMLWYRWSDTYAYLSRELSSAQNFYETAGFKKEYKVTFRNYYGGSGSTGGVIKVRGTQVNSSSIDNLVTQDDAISAEALTQTINYVDLTIDYWSDNLGTSASVNPTPTDHKTYTAYLKGKPNNGYRNLSFNTSQEGQPVRITWSKHPLDNFDINQYAVYRKVTTQGTPTLLTTITANGSSTYTYTDYDYAISSSENKILLFYDVRAYYEPSSAYADVSFSAVYGIYNTSINTDNLVQNISIGETPTEYAITNYPNPFNPATTINYQLPENSFVTIKVFDMLGKEIATLVNENKSAGYYKVNFNASRLTSGVYIYIINAGKYNQSKKIVLMK